MFPLTTGDSFCQKAVSRSWANLHWDEILSKDPRSGGCAPAHNQSALARAPEKAAYQLAGDEIEFYREVKIVKWSIPSVIKLKLMQAF
jgi:hypothetical protein